MKRVLLVVVAIGAAACTSSGHSASSDTGKSPAPPTSPFHTQVTSPTPTLAANIKVYGDCRTPRVEPARIVLACADYGEMLIGLHWTSWSAERATAVGTFRYNDCKPYCAAGHFHEVNGVQAVLSAPVRAATGGLVWSRVHLNPAPDHFPASESLPVRPV